MIQNIPRRLTLNHPESEGRRADDAPWIRRGGRGRGDQGRCWPKAIKAPKALEVGQRGVRTVFPRENRRLVFFWLLFCVFLPLEVGSRHFSVAFFFVVFCCFLVVFLRMVDDEFYPCENNGGSDPTGLE